MVKARHDDIDLWRFAQFIREIDGNVGSCRRHAVKHAQVLEKTSSGFPWQESLRRKHEDEVYADIFTVLKRLRSGFTSLWESLEEIRVKYSKSSEEQIQAIEKVMAGTDDGPRRPELPSEKDIRKDQQAVRSRDWAGTHFGYPIEPDPERHLIDRDVENAKNADDPGDPLKKMSDMLDLLSISTWIEKGIEAVTGVQLSTWIMETAWADWHQFFKIAKVWGQMGNALWDTGDNLQRGSRWNSLYWEGPTADAAHAKIDEFRDALRNVSRTLGRLEDAYTRMAKSLYQATSLCADVFKACIDAVLESALGVGLLVAKAGPEVKRIEEAVDQSSKAMAGLRGAAATFEALLADANADMDDLFRNVPLPLESNDGWPTLPAVPGTSANNLGGPSPRPGRVGPDKAN